MRTAPLSADPAEVIARCVAYKAGVVERDEKEQNERRLLNLGHTVGPRHRKSAAAMPSPRPRRGGRRPSSPGQQRPWAGRSSPLRPGSPPASQKTASPIGTDYAAEALTQAALSTRSGPGESITLVIPRRIGECELRKLPVSELLSVIRAGLEA